MPERREEARFIQIGNRGMAVAGIVSVLIWDGLEAARVDVYLSAPSGGSGYAQEGRPNMECFTGEEAVRFLDWWGFHADVRKL